MKKLALITAAICFGFTGSAFAHGDKTHSSNSATTPHEDHASSIGKPGVADKVTRTVEIVMNDAMRYSPSSVTVKKSETIRFVLRNEGKVIHEMVLGSQKELNEHAKMMRQMPEMRHIDPNMASVEPGKTGELIWEFTKAGSFDFACLQPGHFEAGMKGKIIVKR